MTREEKVAVLKDIIAGEIVHPQVRKDVGDWAVKELSSPETTNKWIPCSERLPEAGVYVDNVAKYYLVQNEYGDMLVARYTHSGYWEQIYHLKPYDDEIVAWMPLPEPYKAEGSDKE